MTSCQPPSNYSCKIDYLSLTLIMSCSTSRTGRSCLEEKVKDNFGSSSVQIVRAEIFL